MALQRIPCKDLLSVTVRQPLTDQIPPSGHCYISFRSGLMSRQDGKMKPDKRKGQFAIVRNNDGCVAVQWFERIAGAGDAFSLADEPEVDQIVFEFEAQFEWLNRDKRLLALKFKEEADRSLFFWLQEPETKWDDDLFTRANKAINGPGWKPPSATLPPAVPGAAATPSTMPPPATAPAPGSASASGLPLTSTGQLFDLNQLVAGMQARSMAASAMAGPSLHEVLTPDAVADFLKLPGMLDALKEHLPAQHRTQEEMEMLPRTAQFCQQLQGFSAALRMGRIDLSQFGLDPKGVTIADFLEAVQALVDKEREEKDDASSPMDS